MTAAEPERRATERIELRESDFSSFYDARYASMVRALSVTLGDSGWGQEAADEAMTRAYDRWHEVSTYANPAGWVYRVGLNWGRSWHRRLNRRLPWAPDVAVLPEMSDLALNAALEDLDMKYRSVVVCRYLLDWSTAQTAEALDIAEGTVKSRLAEGLSRLRVQLGETEPDSTQQTNAPTPPSNPSIPNTQNTRES